MKTTVCYLYFLEYLYQPVAGQVNMAFIPSTNPAGLSTNPAQSLPTQVGFQTVASLERNGQTPGMVNISYSIVTRISFYLLFCTSL